MAEIHRYYIKKSKALGIKDPTPGTINFTQRWGSALNLTPRMHVLCMDGVYSRVQGKAKFDNIDPVTDDEVADLITAISQRVMRYLTKLGYLDPHGEVVENPSADDIFAEHESLSLATYASIAGKYELIRRNVPAGASLLDFGAGPGRVLTEMLRSEGYTVELYEPYFWPNKSALENRYDLVFASEVAQHFCHPHREFQLLYNPLKSYGAVALMTLMTDAETEFANWHYRKDPTHVVFYSRKTFCWTTDRFPFAIVEFDGNRLASLRR